MTTTRLTILFDEHCGFCRRCRDWLAAQPIHVELELLGARSTEASRRYPGITAPAAQLVVVDQDGRTWTGADAFFTALWATNRYRGLATRLAQPAFAPFAGAVYRQVASRRGSLSEWLGDGPCEGVCDPAISHLEAS
jgi:predicted DCC family thiol-disulfide oxidoreductase YuxK